MENQRWVGVSSQDECWTQISQMAQLHQSNNHVVQSPNVTSVTMHCTTDSLPSLPSYSVSSPSQSQLVASPVFPSCAELTPPFFTTSKVLFPPETCNGIPELGSPTSLDPFPTIPQAGCTSQTSSTVRRVSPEHSVCRIQRTYIQPVPPNNEHSSNLMASVSTASEQLLSNTDPLCIPNSVMGFQSHIQTSNFLNRPTGCQTSSNISTELHIPGNSVVENNMNGRVQPSVLPTQQTVNNLAPVQISVTDSMPRDRRVAQDHANCSEDVVFVGEVQKPELIDKSTDIIFVRQNYNRSGLVCLTPKRRLHRKKTTPYSRSISLESATEFKVTISQRQDLSPSLSPASEWTYLASSGLKMFDAKTASLLEYLYKGGSDSSSSITVVLPGTTDTYSVDLGSMKMKHTTSSEEIVLFRKPCIVEDLEPPSLSEFPSHWSSQSNDIQLVALNKSLNTSEWSNILEKMQKSLPRVRIESVERVQNKKLWIRYAFQKAMLLDKNGFEQDVNEKLLFHGTRGNQPCKIWQSEDGFDMRYCNSGAWGLGTYFAEEAAYSHNYAHRLDVYSPRRQMFVASVLTGHCKEMPPDKTLRRPPVRIPATSKNPEVLYDSVSGISVNSRIYILYKFDMAYPSYLVTYSA